MNDPVNEKIAQLTVENAKLKEQLVCKRCGFDNSKERAGLDETFIQEYYKSLISQSTFTKTYPILNGVWQITCEEPTRKLLAAYVGCWDRLDTTIVQYALDLQCVLVISKVEYVGEDGVEVRYQASEEDRLNLLRSITQDNIENIIPDFYQNLPQVILLAIRNTASMFNTLCVNLSESALDKNFWKGVGLN